MWWCQSCSRGPALLAELLQVNDPILGTWMVAQSYCCTIRRSSLSVCMRQTLTNADTAWMGLKIALCLSVWGWNLQAIPQKCHWNLNMILSLMSLDISTSFSLSCHFSPYICVHSIVDIAGLQASLLIRHPETRQLLVNFDPMIYQVIRESECMLKLDLEVPEAAKVICLGQETLKKNFNSLKVSSLHLE